MTVRLNIFGLSWHNVNACRATVGHHCEIRTSDFGSPMFMLLLLLVAGPQVIEQVVLVAVSALLHIVCKLEVVCESRVSANVSGRCCAQQQEQSGFQQSLDKPGRREGQ